MNLIVVQIVIFLLIPQVDYFLAYSGYTLLAFFSVVCNNEKKLISPSNPFVKWLLLAFAILFLSICIRTILSFNSQRFEDLYDFIRFVPLLYPFLLFSTLRSREQILCCLKWGIGVFFLLNAVMALAQFHQVSFLFRVEIERIYNLPNIGYWVYGDGASRAPGLFPGFGEHGLFLGSCLILLLTLSGGVMNRGFSLFFGALTAILILYTQSRTIVIALVISAACYLLVSSAKGLFSAKRKANSILGSVFLAIAVIVFGPWSTIISHFTYLGAIIEDGLSSSSFLARQQIWFGLIGEYSENLDYLVIGFGKGAFSEVSVFDSDPVFFLVTFGLLFFLFVYISIAIIIVRTIGVRNSIERSLFFAVVFYLIAGLGLSSLTQPHVLFILGTLIFLKHQFKAPSLNAGNSSSHVSSL